MLDVVIYTRQGCHLCDDARLLVEQFGLQPRMIDIDADAQLQAKYNECVPVVMIEGKERFRGRVDRILLGRLLAKAQ